MKKLVLLFLVTAGSFSLASAQTAKKSHKLQPATTVVLSSEQAVKQRDEAKKARQGKKVSNENKSGSALIDPRAKQN